MNCNGHANKCYQRAEKRRTSRTHHLTRTGLPELVDLTHPVTLHTERDSATSDKDHSALILHRLQGCKRFLYSDMTDEKTGKPVAQPFRLSHTVRGPPNSSTALWHRDVTTESSKGVNGIITGIDTMQKQVSTFLTELIEAQGKNKGEQ